MISNLGDLRNTPTLLRILAFTLLGAAIGHWLLPLISPKPFSHKIEWITSPWVLTAIGAVLGTLFGHKITKVKTVAFVGGLSGALVGKLVAPLGSGLVAYLWYQLLHFKRSSNNFLFLDFAELFVWVLFIIAGTLIGWLVVRRTTQKP